MDLDYKVGKLNVAIVGLGHVGIEAASQLFLRNDIIDTIFLCSGSGLKEQTVKENIHTLQSCLHNHETKIETMGGGNYSPLGDLIAQDVDAIIYTCGKHHNDRYDPATSMYNIGVAKKFASEYFKNYDGILIVVSNPIWKICYTFYELTEMDPQMIIGMQHIDSMRFSQNLVNELSISGIGHENLIGFCYGHHGEPIFDSSSIVISQLEFGREIIDEYNRKIHKKLESIDFAVRQHITNQMLITDEKTYPETAAAIVSMVEAIYHKKDLPGENISVVEALKGSVSVVSAEMPIRHGREYYWFGGPGYFNSAGRFCPLLSDERDKQTSDLIREQVERTVAELKELKSIFDDITPGVINYVTPINPDKLIYSHRNQVISADINRVLFEREDFITALHLSRDMLYVGLPFSIVEKDISKGKETDYRLTGLHERDFNDPRFESIIVKDGYLYGANRWAGVFRWKLGVPSFPTQLSSKGANLLKTHCDRIFIGFYSTDQEPGSIGISDGSTVQHYRSLNYEPYSFIFTGNSMFILESNGSNQSKIRKWDLIKNKFVLPAQEIFEKAYDMCFAEIDGKEVLAVGCKGLLKFYSKEDLSELGHDVDLKVMESDVNPRRIVSDQKTVFIAADNQQSNHQGYAALIGVNEDGMQVLEQLLVRSYALVLR